MQHFQLLWSELAVEHGDPRGVGGVTTRSIEAGDQSYSDGIGTGRENHLNGSVCRLRRACGNIAPPPGEAGRPRDRAALAAMNKCLAGAHSEFFEPPHRYERLLMVLRRSIHLTLAHGNAWSACRSECLVITKVDRHIRCVEDRDIGVILFPE